MSNGGEAAYLVLLMVLPASALLARRLPLGAAMKMALLWLAIFAGAFLLAVLWQHATRLGGAAGSILR